MSIGAFITSVTPTEPLDLNAIQARYDKARETGNLGNIDDSMADVPTLLAEVTALRVELTERIRRLASHRGVIERQRARAERTEPPWPEPNGVDIYCCEGAYCDPHGMHSDECVERTEPATGEDVARMFHETYERLAPDYGYRTREASAKPWDEVPEQNKALMVATVTEVLAALDLPGREQALREKIAQEILAVKDWWWGQDEIVATIRGN